MFAAIHCMMRGKRTNALTWVEPGMSHEPSGAQGRNDSRTTQLIMFAPIHCRMRMKHTNACSYMTRMKHTKPPHCGTNACSYALTWVDVGFNMKVSVVVFIKTWTAGIHTYFYCLLRVTVRKSSRLCLQQSIA